MARYHYDKDGNYQGKSLSEKEHLERQRRRNQKPVSYSSSCLVCSKLWNYTSSNVEIFNYSDSIFIIKHNWAALSSEKKKALLRKLNPKETWKPPWLFPTQTYEEQMSFRQLMYDKYDRAGAGCYHISPGCMDIFKIGAKKANSQCVCKNCVPEYIKNPNVRTKEENDLVWYKNNTILILSLLFCFPIGFYALYKRWSEKK